MADKTPVRVVFNSSNVATGMAEFQSGETIATSHGGTGLSTIGSAGQVLKVNAAGSGLEFAAEGDVSITNLVAPTNADLTFTTSGTGNIVLDAVTVRGTTLSAADSTKITIAEGLDVTGALTFSGLTLPTSDGSAGQFLRTNGSGTLSFADASIGDLTITGSTISTPSNADLTLTPGGTGGVIASAIKISGTTLSSSDSTVITIAEALDVTGNINVGEDASIVFEGATDNGFETTLTVQDPTADRTITIPNKTGTLATTSDTSFPNSTTPTHPAASADADLGSNLTDSIVDAFSVPTADLYDQMEPRGSTVSVDLGAFS